MSRYACRKDENHNDIADGLRVASPFTGAVLTCPECHGQFYVKKSHLSERKMCSKACMAAHYKRRMVGEGNPNFRYHFSGACEVCGKKFKRYGDSLRFCSWGCARVGAAIMGRNQRQMGHAKRVDANQSEIVEGLRKEGASVSITSALGDGAPDLIIGIPQTNILAEVKNPKTRYGRKGLNSLQRAFSDWWTGPFTIIYTLQDAIATLKSYGFVPKSERPSEPSSPRKNRP